MSLAQACGEDIAVPVTVPTFNGKRYFAECIERMIAQVFNAQAGVVFAAHWLGADSPDSRIVRGRANKSLPSERAGAYLLRLQLDHHNGPRTGIALDWLAASCLMLCVRTPYCAARLPLLNTAISKDECTQTLPRPRTGTSCF
jgi:hypothetical protein